jgi:hypothetical protein
MKASYSSTARRTGKTCLWIASLVNLVRRTSTIDRSSAGEVDVAFRFAHGREAVSLSGLIGAMQRNAMRDGR